MTAGDTTILTCECEHKYQDRKYGKGLRVHNAGKQSQGSQRYNCSVCGKRKER